MATSMTRIAEWNPARGNQFAVISGNEKKCRLELFEIEQDKNKKSKEFLAMRHYDVITGANILQPVYATCLHWRPEFGSLQNNMMAYGTSAGSIHVLDWSTLSESTVYSAQGPARRLCTSIAWNKTNPGLLAAGFEKSRLSSGEFSFAVWNCEHTSSSISSNPDTAAFQSPLFKTPTNDKSGGGGVDEAISCLCWLEPEVLAVGTSLGKVILYDIRQPPQLAEVTIAAHFRTSQRIHKTKGIRLDPFNDKIIATFSSAEWGQEPVKLWDLRRVALNRPPRLSIQCPDRGDSLGTFGSTVSVSTAAAGGSAGAVTSSSGAMISGLTSGVQMSLPTSVGGASSGTVGSGGGRGGMTATSGENLFSSSVVVDVAWSMSRPNVLAVATSKFRSIAFYSTLKDKSETAVSKTPIYTINCPDFPKSLSWQSSPLSDYYVDSSAPPVLLSSSLYQGRGNEGGSSGAAIGSLGVAAMAIAAAAGGAAGGAGVPAVGAPAVAGTTVSGSANQYTVRTRNSGSMLTYDHISERAYNTATTTKDSISIGGSKPVTACAPVGHSTIPTPTAAYETNHEYMSSERRSPHRLLVATAAGYSEHFITEAVGLGVGRGSYAAVATGDYVSVVREVPDRVWRPGSASSATGAGVNVVCSDGVGSQQIIPEDCDGRNESEEGRRELGVTRAGAGRKQETMGLYEHIERVMRLRCVAGYSFNSAKNLQILSDELDSLLADNRLKSASREAHDRAVLGLLELSRVWDWVNRIEAMDHGGHEDISLKTGGAMELLGRGHGKGRKGATTVSEVVAHEGLGTIVYHSQARKQVRQVCGWSPSLLGVSVIGRGGGEDSSLKVGGADGTALWEVADEAREEEEAQEEVAAVIDECERFERAAAIAVWHGDVALAVDILQRHIDMLTAGLHTRKQPQLSHSRTAKIYGDDVGGRRSTSLDGHVFPLTASRDDSLSSSSSSSSSSLPAAGAVGKVDFPGSSDSEAEACKDSFASIDMDEVYTDVTPEYIQLLSLVAMCLAGYMPPALDRLSSSSSPSSSRPASRPGVKVGPSRMWASMCALTLSQLQETDLTRDYATGHRHRLARQYLIAACRFLLLIAEGSTLTAPAGVEESNGSLTPAADVSGGIGGTSAASTASLGVWTGAYGAILSNEHLFLCDRIAFAATYLNDRDLNEWLSWIAAHAAASGRIEGIIATGCTSPQGRSIMQSYIDTCSDIQTPALILARFVDNIPSQLSSPSALISSSSSPSPPPPPSALEREQRIGSGGTFTSQSRSKVLFGGYKATSEGCALEIAWLNEYRGLLNLWQMFIARACLDVEIGKSFRNKQLLQSINNPIPASHSADAAAAAAAAAAKVSNRPAGASVGGGRMAGRGRGSSSLDKKTNQGRILYRLPPHNDASCVFLRCRYCVCALPVDPQHHQSPPAHEKKPRMVVNNCPSCRKELPRCYVCSLYLGFVNPHAEYKRAIEQKRKAADKLLARMTLATNKTLTRPQGNSKPQTTAASPAPGQASAMLEIDKEKEKEYREEQYAIDLGRWFFFCQRCRHGGHADCVSSWFDTPAGGDKSGDSGNDGDEDCSRARDMPVSVESSSRDLAVHNRKSRAVCGVNGCFCVCSAVL